MISNRTAKNENVKLTALQSKLLDAIPNDGDFHRFPIGTRSQTILSLVDRGLIKLRQKPGMKLSAHYAISYADAYMAQRVS